jgi:heme iron utilization protein
MNDTNRALPVLALLDRERHGVLSTLSKKMNGWPFGSVTPYALTAANEPILLMSGLAEHTQNVLADARVSLFVQDGTAIANPQAGPRVTLAGIAERVLDEEAGDARRRFLERFPESASLFQLGDFHLFRLRIERIRYIGGFGEMFWLDGDALSA